MKTRVLSLRWLLGILACALSALAVPAPAAGGVDPVPQIDEIISRMAARSCWEDNSLQGYRAVRRFDAANPRFNAAAEADVLTIFRRPASVESRILRQAGSKFIHKKVFKAILEAESEAGGKQKVQSDILPENYAFAFFGVTDCQGRRCYQLRISAKRKEKFLLNGFVWVDAEDFAIARIQGVPTKRPSFWTLRAEIDRSYTRVGQFWLTDRIDARSDLFIAGRSSLSIKYNYLQLE
jgi:hypothetical protein